MGGNRDYLSGINGNWTIVEDFPRMETKSSEWEGMGTRKSFPHISTAVSPSRE